MSTNTTTFPGTTGPPSLPLRRFTVDEYHRLISSGGLSEDERVELLEGWIVSKMPHNPPHDGMIDLVVGELQVLLPADWFPRIQSAITTTDSEPEPDIAVVRGPRTRYRLRHPGPLEIGILVEVSESTLQQDRAYKAPLYGRAGVPVYWIINLPESRIEVYTEPWESGYQTVRHYGTGELVPIILDGREIGSIAVASLFGK
jgi:Uma2 family endonuclease